MNSITRVPGEPPQQLSPLAATMAFLASLNRIKRTQRRRGHAGPVPVDETRTLADGYRRAARRRELAARRKAAKHARANQRQSNARSYNGSGGLRHGHAPRHVNAGPSGIAAREHMAEIRRHRATAPRGAK